MYLVYKREQITKNKSHEKKNRKEVRELNENIVIYFSCRRVEQKHKIQFEFVCVVIFCMKRARSSLYKSFLKNYAATAEYIGCKCEHVKWAPVWYRAFYLNEVKFYQIIGKIQQTL